MLYLTVACLEPGAAAALLLPGLLHLQATRWWYGVTFFFFFKQQKEVLFNELELTSLLI